MRIRDLIPGMAMVVAAACGGTPTTTPPPGGGTPGSLVVQAGNGQTGPAGTPLPVRPAVLVKDQDGKPLAGVPVAFAVQTGGGSLATPTTVASGSDGVAEAGAWTPGVGSNTLSAQVDGIPAVTFTATGSASGTTVELDITVPAIGGTFTVNRPGDPLDGLSLVIPSPGFGKGAQVQVRTAPSGGVPARQGVRIVSPVMAIESDAKGPARAGVLLKVPAALAAGEWPIAYVFDAGSGSFYSATVAPSGSGMVSVLLPGLDQTGLDVPATSTLFGGHLFQPITNGQTISLVIGAVPLSELAKDQVTGYVPAVDDWEFDYTLATLSPDRRFAPGLALAAAWYFDHFRASHGSLNRRYQKASGVEWSNPNGLALAAVVQGDANAAVGALENYYDTFNVLAATSGLPIDSLQLLGLKAGIYTTGRPQLLYATNIVNDTVQLEGATLLVHAIHGSTIDATLGTTVTGANPPRALTLTNGKFPPISFAYHSPVDLSYSPPITLSAYVSFGPTAGVSAARLNALWQQVFAGTLLNQFRHFTMVSSISRSLTDTLFVPGDTVRVWWESTCDHGYTPGPEITPQGPVGGFSLFSREGTSWSASGGNGSGILGSNVRGHGVRADSSDDHHHIGGVLFCAGSDGDAHDGFYSGWAEFEVRNRRVTISPNPVDALWDTPVTLKATSEYPVPSQPTWVWTLGDGRTVTATTDTVTVTWSAPANTTSADYVVRVSLRSAGTPYAGGSVTARLRPPQIAWRFTSAALGSVQLPPGGIGSESQDTTILNLANGITQDLVANPGNSLLFLYKVPSPSCRALYFEQFPAGQFAPVLDSTGLGALEGFLGSDCPAEPDYTWSLTFGILGSGPLIASAVNIPQPDELSLPGGSINATMSGTVLSGSFVWRVRYSTGIALYPFTFQATQVLPPPPP